MSINPETPWVFPAISRYYFLIRDFSFQFFRMLTLLFNDQWYIFMIISTGICFDAY